MLIIIILFILLVIIPFVCGFFDRGPEWLMRPSMYLNIWLLKMANFGFKVKSYLRNLK
jgi:hypothetical protein